jgi:hypothetical protein
VLIQQLNKLLAEDLHVAVLKALKKPETKVEYVVSLLAGPSRACYETLPLEIQIQLILDRDSHGVKLGLPAVVGSVGRVLLADRRLACTGNVTVAQIETEKLLGMVRAEASGQCRLNPCMLCSWLTDGRRRAADAESSDPGCQSGRRFLFQEVCCERARGGRLLRRIQFSNVLL